MRRTPRRQRGRVSGTTAISKLGRPHMAQASILDCSFACCCNSLWPGSAIESAVAVACEKANYQPALYERRLVDSWVSSGGVRATNPAATAFAAGPSSA